MNGSAIRSDAMSAPIGAYAEVMPFAVVMRSGPVAEALGAEVLAEAPPAADDLVGDEQDVVLVADLAHAREVAVGRREAAAGVLHRLEDHGGDRVRALELDALADRLGELHRIVALVAVHVRVRDVGDAGRQRLERLAQRGDARRGERAERRAVVGGVARDDLRLQRLAVELVELARQLDRGLDRLAAAAREEDAVEVARARGRRCGPRA